MEIGASACVVMTSGGYPGPYETERESKDWPSQCAADVAVFHAGTKRDAGFHRDERRTSAGVTAMARISSRRLQGVRGVGKIDFAGAHYRTDIGAMALPNRALPENFPVAEVLHCFRRWRTASRSRIRRGFAVENKGLKDCVHGGPGAAGIVADGC